MGLHQNFGKKLKKEKKPLFSLQALFAFAPSLWAVIVIEGLFVLYFQIIRYKEPLIIFLIIEILFFYLIFLIIFRIKNRNLLKERSDFRKNDPEIINGELMFSQPISGKSRRSVPDAVLETFYREQKAVYQKVFYSESGSPFSEKYFYCVITDLKLNALKSLYHVNPEYRDIGVFLRSMQFSNGVPLRFIVGKESRVLKEIQPVPDYKYSESQLSAINEFNGSFSDTEKPEQKKSPGLAFAPLYLLLKSFLFALFIALTVSFGYSFILFLLRELIFGIDRTRYIISLVLTFPLCYVGISMTTKNFYFFLYGSDLNKSHTVKGHFVLAHTNGTRDGFTKELNRIFPDLYPAFYQIKFKIDGLHIENQKVNKANTLNTVLTSEKVSVLKDIYPLDVRRAWALGNTDSLGLDNVINFHDDIPLIITYQEKSNILQSIAPAEGYDYTEEQLAAIEKFNMLYP